MTLLTTITHSELIFPFIIFEKITLNMAIHTLGFSKSSIRYFYFLTRTMQIP